ncbi:MAG TPA: HAMP domain-containing sensor histidine kinase [Candidatus Paceibacterota bacterium]
MRFFLGILGTLTVVFAAFSVVHINRNRTLREQLKKAQDSVAQTSRLMIEKNVELFDQNVRQQRELGIKDDFIAIASHQLRTPLNEIKWGMGELIESAKTKKNKQAYDQVFDSAKRMEKIVEDLLRFVEVEQNHIRAATVPYEPDATIRASSERVAKDFLDSGVSLQLNLAFGAKISSIDASAFEMIIDNMLENAYHYTPQGGAIRVRSHAGEGGILQLEVEDSGIGIPEEMAQNMFVKFRRSEEAIARNKEGSGLGLYIVKTLLDRAGGAITFESKEGKGTTFRLVFLKEKPFGKR